MSDKGDNDGILGKVYQLQLEQTGRLNRMEGEITGINTHLKQIDARLEVGSSTIHDQGGKLIVQETQATAAQKRIDAIENTQRAAAVEKRTKLAVWKRLGAAITIALSIASAFKLGECITTSTRITPRGTRVVVPPIRPPSVTSWGGQLPSSPRTSRR